MGAVACAVHNEEIGVDIERRGRPPNHLGQGMEPEAFFRLWTAREATVKRRGQGIAALMRGEAPGSPVPVSSGSAPRLGGDGVSLGGCSGAALRMEGSDDESRDQPPK